MELNIEFLDEISAAEGVVIVGTSAIYVPRVLLGKYLWYRRIRTREVVGWLTGWNSAKGFIILWQHCGIDEPKPIRVYLENIRSLERLARQPQTRAKGTANV